MGYYKCPKCGSASTRKDKCLGHDTGDRICNDCGYEDVRAEFERKREVHDLENQDKVEEQNI